MNKLYGNAIFCPNCRKLIREDEILYECKLTRDRQQEEAHRASWNKARGRTEAEQSFAESGFHYYFRRPPLRMFRKKDGNAICPVCKTNSSAMVCSQCLKPLSTTAKRTEAISVVGIKGCGKTVYIGALINEIRQFFSARHITVTVEKGLSENYNLQGGQKLPGGTPSGIISPVQIHFGREENGKYPFDLLIYDIAGEDLSKSDAPTELFHHLSMSSLIIYLFDPLTGKYHRKDMAGWGSRPEIQEHADRCETSAGSARIIDNDGIVDLIIEKIRVNYQNDLHGSRLGSKKLPIYVAACISASDFLRWQKHAQEGYDADKDIQHEYYLTYRAIDYMNPANCITSEALERLKADGDAIRKRKIADWEERGLLDRTERTNLDRKMVEQIVAWMQKDSERGVEETLERWQEGGVCLKFEGGFKEVSYFGLSSLSMNPAWEYGEFICPEAYVPRNVINPLIWYFKKEGILDLLKKSSL